MIILGLQLQNTDKVPEKIAAWVEERNEAFPDIKFEINKYTPPAEEIGREGRTLVKDYQRSFSGSGSYGDSAKSGVLFVSFFYGKEIWSVKITGGINENRDIRNMFTLPEGEKIVRPLPPELRNKIAGFEAENYRRLEIKGQPERGVKDSVVYVEVRSHENPLTDHAEHLREINWEARQTSTLSMTGSELGEMMQDPKKVEIASSMLRDGKEGKHMN